MKMRIALHGLVGVLSLFVLGLVVAPAAQAYPEVTFHADVSAQVVFGGESFTATSSANVECAWKHQWNGTTHRGLGKSYTSTFTAPKVKKRTVIPLHFTCTYAASASARAQAQTWQRTVDVTVVPAHGHAQQVPSGNGNHAALADAGGDLPNTGGPSVLFLVGGLLLLLAGAVAVRVARGRGADADADAATQA